MAEGCYLVREPHHTEWERIRQAFDERDAGRQYLYNKYYGSSNFNAEVDLEIIPEDSLWSARFTVSSEEKLNIEMEL